ncbi:MAG TPA: exodeoxyribonuclease VII small subunit [Actinocrinis sp.]|nr:exodeoxyribonuclease VII small subunit [Actinocrinis sp.]
MAEEANSAGTGSKAAKVAAGADLTGLGYEQAREELVATVQRLEAGGLSLEDSLALWERGEALAAHCQAKLDGARERLDAAVAAREEG